MCTVVVRTSGDGRTQILALRDELTSRDFDDPGQWWPQFPGVVGGRDRTAGGTWCAARIDNGLTALVLNTPQKRVADPAAPSRGLLPLLGVHHEDDWSSHLDITGMASFLLVLATPDRLTSWTFDGTELLLADHAPGTHMFTSGGAEDGKAERHLAAFQQDDFPDGWRGILALATPTDDPAALVVRHQSNDSVFATVFGQLIEAQAGRLDLQYSRQPWTDDPWQTLTYR
jgi:hypothetical protein